MRSAAVISFLKRSQKTRVSSATSREGGGAVGINFVRWPVQILRAVVLCHATVSRASVAKQISIIIRWVRVGLRCESSCARQSFLRRYNLVYECILELFSNPTRLEPGTERFDVCSDLPSRDHRLPGHIDHGPPWK